MGLKIVSALAHSLHALLQSTATHSIVIHDKQCIWQDRKLVKGLQVKNHLTFYQVLEQKYYSFLHF